MDLTAHAAGALSHACTRFGRALSVLTGAALVIVFLAGEAGTALAAEPGLEIELNTVEDNGGSCLASFVVRNGLGHTLDRFSMDLFVFDRDGVIARQVLLDLAPLRNDKTTVARFSLIKRACADVGRILINDIPSCRSAATGEELDCLAGLAVSSRARIEMIK